MGPDHLTHATSGNIRADLESAWRSGNFLAGAAIIQRTLENPDPMLHKALTPQDVAWVTRQYVESGIRSPKYSGLFFHLRAVEGHPVLEVGANKGIVRGVRTLIESENIEACLDIYKIIDEFNNLPMIQACGVGIGEGVLNRASQNPAFIRDLAFACADLPLGAHIIPNAIAHGAMFMVRRGDTGPLQMLSDTFPPPDEGDKGFYIRGPRQTEKNLSDAVTNGIAQGLRDIAGRNVDHSALRALYENEDPAWQVRIKTASGMAGVRVVCLPDKSKAGAPLTVIFHRNNPAYGQSDLMHGPVATIHFGEHPARTLPEMLTHLRTPYAHLIKKGAGCDGPSPLTPERNNLAAEDLAGLFRQVVGRASDYPHFAKLAARSALEEQNVQESAQGAKGPPARISRTCEAMG